MNLQRQHDQNVGQERHATGRRWALSCSIRKERIWPFHRPHRKHRKATTTLKTPILAVEYKGADRWNGAEDDRLIGGLWANLSQGRCRFVMVKDKRWDWVEEALK